MLEWLMSVFSFLFGANRNAVLSRNGQVFIGKREGCCLPAHPDRYGTMSIGFGHTAKVGPPTPVLGMRFTKAQAVNQLKTDAAKFEKNIRSFVKVPLLPHEWDAIVSMTYHLGPGTISRSEFIRQINRGDRDAAWAAYPLLFVNPIHTPRREAERRIFQDADYGDLSTIMLWDEVLPSYPPDGSVQGGATVPTWW